MPASFDVGDAVPLTWELFAADGTTRTDATVSLTVTSPTGAASSPAVTHTGTGVYTASYSPAAAGTYLFRWVATGTLTAAEEGSFRVRVAGTNLIAVQDVRARLNKSLTVDNDEIQDMIDAACAEYTQYVGPLGGTVTERLDGGTPALILSSSSVAAITSAAMDGTAINVEDLDLDTRTGIVYWGSPAGRFSYGSRNVTVTYTVGSLPANHREAIIADVAGYFAATQRGGGAGPSFSSEGYEEAFHTHPLNLFPRIRALAVPGIA